MEFTRDAVEYRSRSHDAGTPGDTDLASSQELAVTR